MMRKSLHIPRRTFLKGLGTVVALPMLESMMPLRAMSASTSAVSAPKRLAFIYVPNGVIMDDWAPKEVGKAFDLPRILEPLKAHRDRLTVLGGLAHDKARANGDGPGDHARASATFLTGCQARKTASKDISVGVSVDQIAAQQIGHLTRLPSLELGCDKARLAGSCDSGYSCAYSYNLSWRTESSPMPAEANPRLVFDRLFANEFPNETEENRARRRRQRKSILDFVLEDARDLKRQLGTTDSRKLDEYLYAVRELEQRIERAEQFEALAPEMEQPEGIPDTNEEHVRLMMDLMVLAFQTDSTRIATFSIAHDGSNRSYREIGVSEGHHDLSHHGGDVEKIEKIAKINCYHTRQFAYLLDKLQAASERDGSLLDNSMIVYGSGISDGARHSHHDLPVLLAGGGAGTLQPGRHLRHKRDTPMTNLYLSLLDRMDVQAERMGDSTGKLEDI
jgi:hypothetical protein